APPPSPPAPRAAASRATPARIAASRPYSSGRLGGDLARLGRRLLDGPDHIEGALRQIVVIAGDDRLEAFDRVLEIDIDAGLSGEHFGDVHRLRQELLDLPGARDGEPVLF